LVQDVKGRLIRITQGGVYLWYYPYEVRYSMDFVGRDAKGSVLLLLCSLL